MSASALPQIRIHRPVFRFHRIIRKRIRIIAVPHNFPFFDKPADRPVTGTVRRRCDCFQHINQIFVRASFARFKLFFNTIIPAHGGLLSYVRALRQLSYFLPIYVTMFPSMHLINIFNRLCDRYQDLIPRRPSGIKPRNHESGFIQ